MRMFFNSLGAFVYITFFVVLAILVGFGVWAGLFPLGLAVQRNAVEQSKSYTDSTNTAMIMYMQDWQKLDTEIAKSEGNVFLIATYRGQQRSDINLICATKASMRPETVSSVVLQFISQNGGC